VLTVDLLLLLKRFKTLRGPYRDWAQGHVDVSSSQSVVMEYLTECEQKIRGVLQSARDSHTSAVRERITSVEAMKEVVPLTSQLFELSKETAKLEAANFELRQKVAMAAEVKSVLDSWVRFEQGQKAAEQEQLVKSIIDKVMKNINDEKVQKDILAGAVAEIERKSIIALLHFPLGLITTTEMVKNKAI
jgi:F-type H+-transporting ATPase subunit b